MATIDLSKLPNQPKGKTFDLTMLPNQPKKKSKILTGAKNFGIGLGLSAGETLAGIGSIVEGKLKRKARLITPKQFEKPLGLGRETFGGKLLEQGTFKPQTTGQSLGKFAGDVAQFAIPATKVGKLQKGAGVAQRLVGGAKQGLLSGGIESLKQGGINSSTGTAVGMGALAGTLLPNWARTTVNVAKAIPSATVNQSKKIATTVPKAAKTTLKELTDPKFAASQSVKRSAIKTASQAKKEAPSIGLQPSYVNLVKRSTPEVKGKMSKMLRYAEDAVTNKNSPRPLEPVVGKDLTNTIKKLAKQQAQIGQKIGKEKSLVRDTGATVDTSSILNKFTRQLQNKGVVLDGNKVTNWGSVASKGDRSILQNTLNFLSKPRSSKAIIDESDRIAQRLKLGKQQKKLSEAESLTKIVRNGLKKEAGKISPTLSNLQKEYAILEDALSSFNKSVGNKKYTPESMKDVNAATIAGRLLNRDNRKAKEVITKILRASDKINKTQLADKKLSEITKLTELSNILEDILKIAPSRSLKAQMSGVAGEAIEKGAVLVDAFNRPVGTAVDVVTKGILKKTEKDLTKTQLEFLKKLLSQ